MKKATSMQFGFPGRVPFLYKVVLLCIIVLVTCVIFAGPPPPITLRIMKMGTGAGVVTTSTGLNCGGSCDGTYESTDPLTLTAINDAGSVFVRWEGDVTGSTNPITVTLGANASVRAVFDLSTPIPLITDFTPTGIQNYLNANLHVNTPALFLKALPDEYKQNWILMTRSESLQTGTAEFPRLLLPSADARYVFSIGQVVHESYPGSDPKAIEYMQWDEGEKNFRFHEIILAHIDPRGVVPARERMVSPDDSKCGKCHSTNNVINLSAFPGTTGIVPGTVKFKNKPNWDPNDSWGGMTPFNRDRIYNGSVEAAAIRKIFNLWNWRTNDSVRALIEQLQLQPPGVPVSDAITRTVGGINDGHINFAFDILAPVFTEPAPVGDGTSTTSNYNFDNAPGAGAGTPVITGGAYVTLRHSSDVATTGPAVEGRGVQFFDLLGGLDGTLNQKRISDELINHRFATSNFPIDVRPIALAIAKGFIQLNAAKTAIVSTVPLTVDLGFFNARNANTINEIYNDTKTRSESLTRRRADIQRINLDRTGDLYLSVLETIPTGGLIQTYGSNTAAGTSTIMSRIRQDVFRRPIDGGGTADVTVMGGKYVDQELYTASLDKLTLFRYFLQPLGVSVDKWSMGVRGRSRTYTFANGFNTYINVFDTELKPSLDNPADPRYRPVAGLTNANDETQLMGAVNSTLATLPTAIQVPTFTDVQRIFNKACIECHGGLDYPPYSNYGTAVNFTENENPMGTGTPGASPRLANSHLIASSFGASLLTPLYQRITRTSEECPSGMMPCGGPSLAKTDIETIRRWIEGGKPYTNGDPHIKTVDGVSYDFQAAGEYILLSGENLQVQARHTPVETNGALGPNGHTGLTSCVSLNTAIAIKAGSHRITYQPNIKGEPDPSGMQLRVDGKLVSIERTGISLGVDGRIMPTSAPGGIQVEATGGTVLVITPGWWDHYKVWYLNLDTRKIRATMGLMGVLAPGSWLPALPDGNSMGPMPRDLNQRYNDLYFKFGNAWRVTDSTSLFDYAPGTSTKSFSVEGWPNGNNAQSCKVPGQNGDIKPRAPFTRQVAEQLAAGITAPDHREDAIKDLMATGDSTFARTYLLADKINRNNAPDAPVLIYPADFDSVSTTPVDFKWNKSTDKDGDKLSYGLHVWPVNELPDLNKALPLSSSSSSGLAGGSLFYWIVGLIALLFVLLYFTLMKQRRGLLVILVLILLAILIGAYFLKSKGQQMGQQEVSKEMKDLQQGKAYFWKVIVEDGQGGVTESETRRVYIR